jgi:sugar transferase (PEP-CTERM/EpsH1 system associated)
MRILMLAHRLPYPPRTGDRVRAYHVARHLARRHELTLACLVDEPESAPDIEALRTEIPDLEHVEVHRARKRLAALLSLPRGASATMAYFDSAALRARLAARLREPVDLIYVSSSSMAQYATDARRAPILMDFVDVDSDKWRQYGARLPAYKAWVYRIEAERLRRHEIAAARRAARSLVATGEEERLLRSLAPWAPTTVIPNGVDLEYFAPRPRPAAAPSIVFTGVMDYFPNVDAVVHFCADVFPRIRAEVPEARFVVVGKRPAAAVRRLAAMPGVQVTGPVPDVRPYLGDAAVAVAPLRVARGVQNKVLEAMGMGVPVVATARAREGLEARPGRDLLVEDDAQPFADAVVDLLRRPARRLELGRAGRAFVESHHSWAASMARLDAVLAEITRRPSRAGGNGAST